MKDEKREILPQGSLYENSLEALALHSCLKVAATPIAISAHTQVQGILSVNLCLIT